MPVGVGVEDGGRGVGECGVVDRVLRDRVEEVMVNVKGIVSEKPRDKLDTAELRIEYLRVNDKAAVDLGAPVDVFLLAYGNILILGSKLFGVDSNSIGGTT